MKIVLNFLIICLFCPLIAMDDHGTQRQTSKFIACNAADNSKVSLEFVRRVSTAIFERDEFVRMRVPFIDGITQEGDTWLTVFTRAERPDVVAFLLSNGAIPQEEAILTTAEYLRDGSAKETSLRRVGEWSDGQRYEEGEACANGIEINDAFIKLITAAARDKQKMKALKEYYAWGTPPDVDQTEYAPGQMVGQWLDENLANDEYPFIRMTYAIVAPYRTQKNEALKWLLFWHIRGNLSLSYINTFFVVNPSTDLSQIVDDSGSLLQFLQSEAAEAQDPIVSVRAQRLIDYYKTRTWDSSFDKPSFKWLDARIIVGGLVGSVIGYFVWNRIIKKEPKDATLVGQ